MDVGEQCVVRDGGTLRLVWSVLDWDSQDKVNQIPGIAICERIWLLYLYIGAQVEQFGESSNRPIYNLSCSSPESDSPDCTVTPAPDSCDHSMDLGVRCLSHQEVTSSSSDNSSTALGAVTNNSSEVLGAVTGLLMVVVIVLAIGWILTCLIMKKRQR